MIQRTRLFLVERVPTSRRQVLILAHDLTMSALSFVAAYLLRLSVEDMSPAQLQALSKGLPLFVAVAAGIYLLAGLYRELWRYVSIDSLVSLLKAATLAILTFYVLSWIVNRGGSLPRSLPLIQWLVLVTFLCGPRLMWRFLVDRRRSSFANQKIGRIPIVLVGADEAASLFLRSLQHDPHPLYRPLAILDPDSRERMRWMLGTPVHGVTNDLEQAFAQLLDRRPRPARLVVTKPLGSETMRTLLAVAERYRLTIWRLPSFAELRQAQNPGHVQLKPIAAEELLGRSEAVLDEAAVSAFVRAKRILVTGAGGSIGSELVRQIARRGPARLVLVDSGEYNLYAIDHELGGAHPALPRRAVLANIRDGSALMRLFAEELPELVFHAAALKHVPLVEANLAEAVRTNALGTRNVADAAKRFGAKAFVQVSTDKAVNPTSMMGASKRVAELYVQALDFDAARPTSGADGSTRFMTVRFGNVLGSSGSVIPLFERQLAAGGPITVTHPEITRYFMTIREAVQLVLQASAHGVRAAGKRGRIFVLDMGKPVKIIDVARQMIRLAGLEPERDIKIDIVGLRPGEKLYEELFNAEELPLSAVSAGVLEAVSRPVSLHRIRGFIDEMTEAAERGDDPGLRRMLAEAVSGGAIADKLASVA